MRKSNTGTLRDAAIHTYSYITKSIELGMEGKIDAVSTAAINKAALKMADVPYIGHTEIYQELTHSPYALTMFNVHKLRVFSSADMFRYAELVIWRTMIASSNFSRTSTPNSRNSASNTRPSASRL